MLRLALLRFLLLPLYARWWVRQTCSSVFLLLFLLYITQIINWAIYIVHLNPREQQRVEAFSNQTMDIDIKLKVHKNIYTGQIPESTEVGNSPTKFHDFYPNLNIFQYSNGLQFNPFYWNLFF